MTETARSDGQLALIVEIVDRFGRKGRIGKKALQKLIFLLQELHGVPGGFRFRYFTYGPFSDDLAYSLDVAEGMGGVRVRYDPDANAYDISTGAESERVRRRGSEVIDEHRLAIDKLADRFGGRTATSLELTATIVYLAGAKVAAANRNELIGKVMSLKPKYNRGEVDRAIEELVAKA